MCWLIRLQNPVHSRLFEACADPEGWAGGGGGGGGGKVAFAKHTYISNKPFFEYVHGRYLLASRKGVVTGGPTLATF